MPKIRLRHPDIPPALMGWTLVDAYGRPRYWSTVWSALDGAALADSTLSSHLTAIEALYQAAAQQHGRECLDALITALDIEALEGCLECLFVQLRNRAARQETDANKAWTAAYAFAYSCVQRLAKSHTIGLPLADLQRRLEHLDRLYRSLNLPERPPPQTPRALPADVLEELYALIDPTSRQNPFRTEMLKWRNYLLVLLLLHQGLRRSEALALPLDALKGGSGKRWLDIHANTYERDQRAEKPNLKNHYAVRQIPVSALIAKIYNTFVANYRGRQPHTYLFSSQEGKALSIRSVNAVFSVLSRHLSAPARKTLIEFTREAVISPHDLRHTCATVRIRQFIDIGDEMDVALQKMRVFFGWSRDSTMPQRYARAYFEHRLSTTWNDSFDLHVDALRALSKGIPSEA